jgi:carbon storage regulator
MLVLSRKKQEAVIVAGPGGESCLVKITVLEVRAGQVRLGFEADGDVAVHRCEVWQRLSAFQDKLPLPNGNGVAGVQPGSTPNCLKGE